MKVVLEVTSYTTHRVLTEYGDTIEEAKDGFDPCEDLHGSEVTGGNTEIDDAYEVIDCPDCLGKGTIRSTSEDFPKGYPKTCRKCSGRGYIKKEEG